ncbi:L,D-transpeptidase family protein [Phytopseudomonas dryadis]|uniref:Murein L,D-transpeptidase n=1 Tax=Phytopseudomonas dryadis TaxID=2487520 RepID=A0A4Q9R2R1_9GAMM|nr:MULTISPECIES: L,D-transpeptidase family protein [Pseudomonas]TBU92721.1 murein L,D-transpeptidase [Pseudomonas dryadis]TBV00581.1 murein L,D-transpeptidase [Pseudomonas dryadis]TBV14507.1 murein L,D-transpeptidase [Pseudomonas sp. FRB 230]
MFSPTSSVAWALALIAPLALADAMPPSPLEQQLAEPSLTCVSPALNLTAKDREWLEPFYLLRGSQPVWSEENLPGLFAQLDALADDGLEPRAYHLEPLRELAAVERPSPRLSACVEVLATTAYLQALRDLAHGRLDQARVEPLWQPEDMVEQPSQAPLLAIAQAGLTDPAQAFEQARPDFSPYRALRQRYAELRRQALPQWLAIPGGTLLRPGAVDGRVPLLEQRLQLHGDLSQGAPALVAEDSPVYATALVEAVKAFQRNHLLKPDGIVGPGTLAELNRSASERMDQLRINLERLRWLSRELEPTSVLIDVAGAEVMFLRDGAVAWQARTQVGRPARPTPLLRSRITHLTLNPTWTIPPTILREDKLPQLRRDAAGYLAANHMRVIDYDGNTVDPRGVDWERPGRVMIRQDAGPHSPLGRVAIRFPNPFSVYLHDTPSQRLFDNLPRLFSSGCVRIERVTELVDQLLAEATPAERARIARQWESGRTLRADLPRPVPILMAYWTAQVGGDGQLQFRPDIYGHDARLLKALEASNRI